MVYILLCRSLKFKWQVVLKRRDESQRPEAIRRYSPKGASSNLKLSRGNSEWNFERGERKERARRASCLQSMSLFILVSPGRFNPGHYIPYIPRRRNLVTEPASELFKKSPLFS